MKLKNPLFWIVAIAGLLIDYITKQQSVQWVIQNYGEETLRAMEAPNGSPQSIDMTTVIEGVLNFTFLLNKGAAFGAFSENGAWLKWLSLVVSLALIVYGWRVKFPNQWETIGYGFLLSGALGNGVERLFKGYVVDFIAVFPTTNLPFINGPFPVFNMADIWINLGILCLLIAAIKEPDEKTQRNASPPRRRSR